MFFRVYVPSNGTHFYVLSVDGSIIFFVKASHSFDSCSKHTLCSFEFIHVLPQPIIDQNIPQPIIDQNIQYQIFQVGGETPALL